MKHRGEGRREGVSLQQKRYETLLLTSTYNQMQAHAEYEIVSITTVPRLHVLQTYILKAKLRRMKVRHMMEDC